MSQSIAQNDGADNDCEEHGRNAVNRYSINELGDLPLATWLADLSDRDRVAISCLTIHMRLCIRLYTPRDLKLRLVLRTDR